MANSPETIGGYHILKELGFGGFATVYLAKSAQNDEVALKVLNPLPAGKHDQEKRFQQEAEVMAGLDHPNIVKIIEFGEDNQHVYIAMEYVAGGTLGEALKNGPLDRVEAMDLIRQIGGALSYAHSRQIIHRDVKPGNILLDTSSNLARPVLTDFGLVKLLLKSDTSLTRTGSLIGTLRYMAPEQMDDHKTSGPIVDLYSLAIMCFEMLAGRPPFEADSVMKLMDKHRSEPMPPLSTMAPNIGPFFDDILKQAAAKNPSDRFDSVGSFIEALEEASQQAEELERRRIEQQNHATGLVASTKAYMQQEINHTRALETINMALDLAPGFVDALCLKGEIYLDRKQIPEALECYKEAFEQVRRPTSKPGLEYLNALHQAANQAWLEDEKRQVALEYYHTILQILGEGHYTNELIQNIWDKTRSRLIEHHYYLANRAYAGGKPQDLEEAIRALTDQQQWLRQLKDDSKVDELEYWEKRLQIEQRQREIGNYEAAIASRLKQVNDAQIPEIDEIIRYYVNIDEHYQKLIELDPGNFRYRRREKLREQARFRLDCARQAVTEPNPDYENAVGHYKALQKIDENDFLELANELKLNLTKEIAQLEQKADLYSKYQHIRGLMNHNKYEEALGQLETDFIQPGNYGYRDVARLLWELVAAQQQEEEYPLAENETLGLEILRDRLQNLEGIRLEKIKTALALWANSYQIIAAQHQLLADYHEQLQRLEQGLAEISQNEYAVLRQELETWGSQLQRLETGDVSKQLSDWIQQVDQLAVDLISANQINHIRQFFDQSDEAIAQIEDHEIFQTWQAVGPPDFKAERKVQTQLAVLLAKNIDWLEKASATTNEGYFVWILAGVVVVFWSINLLLGVLFWDWSQANFLGRSIIFLSVVGPPLILVGLALKAYDKNTQENLIWMALSKIRRGN